MWHLFLSLWLSLNAALAEPVRTNHVTADLLSEMQSVQPGKQAWIGLMLTMEPQWHTYWQYPGDSGLPTKVKWKLPEGWKVGEPVWPLPSRIIVPPLVNFGYHGETMILFPIAVPANASGTPRIDADVSWLVCKEECVPGKASVSLNLKLSAAEPAKGSVYVAFQQIKAETPKQLPQGAFQELKVDPKRVGLKLDDDPSWIDGRKLDLFPLESQSVKGDAPPTVEGKGAETTLWMDKATPFKNTAASFRALLVLEKHGKKEAFLVDVPMSSAAAGVGAATAVSPDGNAPVPSPPAPKAPPAAKSEVLLSALFAFLGGILLNLMPCVFPVLGIKVMALVSQGAGDRWHAPKHGKVYTLGVLVSFWALTAVLLGLRQAGQAVGWGFQLQSPAFVMVLVFLFTLISANLMGAFEFGGRWVGMGSGLANRDGYAGSFFTGILAVIVATPCTAPFMGTAIGVVLGQPAWVVFVVFTFLALGLALPFLVLAYQPRLLRMLPKPGGWMETLKEFFAFPMAATVLWLIWVLGQQKGLNAAVGTGLSVLVLCSGFWAWHRFNGRAGHFVGLALFIASFGSASLVLTMPAVPAIARALDGDWGIYTPEALAKARGEGKPVFVDFTAAWCLTCQVNKRTVLESESMAAFFREKGVVLLLADWTNYDANITAALEAQGRIGVPLYLVYTPGADQAKVLPQILTDRTVREAFP